MSYVLGSALALILGFSAMNRLQFFLKQLFPCPEMKKDKIQSYSIQYMTQSNSCFFGFEWLRVKPCIGRLLAFERHLLRLASSAEGRRDIAAVKDLCTKNRSEC